MSACVSELKARLASVKQTRQITNAMYLLSASRLKKLMPGMGYAVSYMQSLREAMAGVLGASNLAGMHQRFIDIDSKGTALIMREVTVRHRKNPLSRAAEDAYIQAPFRRVYTV